METQPFAHLADEGVRPGRPNEIDADVDPFEEFRNEQLKRGIHVQDFWTTKSVRENAEEQGVLAVTDIDELSDDTISEQEADAFMEALGLGPESLRRCEER